MGEANISIRRALYGVHWVLAKEVIQYNYNLISSISNVLVTNELIHTGYYKNNVNHIAALY
jgi:hypothetical protein